MISYYTSYNEALLFYGKFLVIWDVVIIDRDCNCNQMIYLRIHQSL